MNDGGSGDVAGAGDDSAAAHGARGEGPRTAQATRSGAAAGRQRGGGERRMVPKERPRSYYGRAIIEEPTWTWEIPWYLFAGGLSGASSMLGLTASLSGNDELARRAWIASFAGIAASPALLISDLGRPERFLNMLRVFKLTSPMSVGSWILSMNGAAITPAAAGVVLGLRGRWVRPAEVAAGLLGLPLATYTGVLLSNSVIPVWSEARRELPLLFAAGGAASAGAVAVAMTPVGSAGSARRLAVGGALAELAVTTTMEHRLGSVGKPYEEGKAGRFGKAAKLLAGAGAAVIGASRGSRSRAVAGAGLVLAGAICTRWSVFEAGFASARDPHYTADLQRSRMPGRNGT